VPALRPLIAIVVLGAALAHAGGGEVRAHSARPPPLPVPKPALRPAPGTALLSATDRNFYKYAFAAVKKGRWRRAENFASRAQDPLPAKIVTWLHYTEPGTRAPFEELAAFIEANPHWPRQRALRRAAEAALGDKTPDARALEWLAEHPPVSGEGRVRLAEALMRTGWPDVGAAWLRHAWIMDDFPARREGAIRRRHKKLFTREDHEARLDRLLWDGRRRAARRMLRRVSKGHRALAEARLRLMQRAGGVDGAIARVPAELQSHPGLVYERLRWRRRKGFDDKARELLFDPPDDVVRPKAWWIERGIQVRKALHAGHVTDAYRLARDHAPLSGQSFAEAEWLAGWVALRFLGDAKDAFAHFQRLYRAVRFPVSRARGAYWAGRAAERLGERDAARTWYETGARHPTVFYGQLAAQRLEDPALLELEAAPEPAAAEAAAFAERELARAVRLLAELGEEQRLRPFVMALNASARTPVEHTLVARLAARVGRPDLGVRSAKRSVRKGIMVPEQGYPVVGLGQGARAEQALLLAISRQESEFNPKAVSGSGARGLMQLMPATARLMAKRLKMRYAKSRLVDDPVYNATLGSAYLGDLIQRYRGSYVLAIAAYNAGPSRVKRWLRDNGDPRLGQVDVIDWIELIPFSETRNYVQRVLEALQVYRLRLNGATVRLGLKQDLRR
jgi:soluble lytic murein transglycosylase